ncbi:hypothetical protein [Chryseobacterium sp. Leaf394]|uniref:hypothetical protein n=1 Tax=Chryseobacterium sp. Leaf394 TaxID=1736361 RepID=UPI0006F8491B|nr:hypothetical protein [Chryseobacterium sp. Leaf394]KQS89851.1 hypothetical protein ASG21_12780 [Chryseobacterium sp. Leaf394]
MKKYIFSAVMVSMATFASAQVSFGGKQTVEGTSTLVDFNSPLTADTNSTTNNNTSGIILPAVEKESSVTAPSNGTFIYDHEAKMVKMFQQNSWIQLSDAGNNSQIVVNSATDLNASHGAIIGSPTSAANGILVLESDDKAMILPRIQNPHQNVKSPYPGMMCYDTVKKALAVFDGTLWNYWK